MIVIDIAATDVFKSTCIIVGSFRLEILGETIVC